MKSESSGRGVRVVLLAAMAGGSRGRSVHGREGEASDFPGRAARYCNRHIAAHVHSNGSADAAMRGLDRKKKWCSGQDSNLHALRHTPLKRVCLPIPPPEHFHEGRRTKSIPPHLVKPRKWPCFDGPQVRKSPPTGAADLPAQRRVPERERVPGRSWPCRFESDLRLRPFSQPHSHHPRSHPRQ